ncbi:27184_t:CDS:2 [Dentiscutata erythropus]|uniref:27184_t:CDS:1 n=1 Tax=Dentiscutata erythropus TaxID=1348616 RepID=A0A9N9DXB2_9GLOM|nr:27184_t:CDS:2 [Dentiscutata erythropus]
MAQRPPPGNPSNENSLPLSSKATKFESLDNAGLCPVSLVLIPFDLSSPKDNNSSKVNNIQPTLFQKISNDTPYVAEVSFDSELITPTLLPTLSSPKSSDNLKLDISYPTLPKPSVDSHFSTSRNHLPKDSFLSCPLKFLNDVSIKNIELKILPNNIINSNSYFHIKKQNNILNCALPEIPSDDSFSLINNNIFNSPKNESQNFYSINTFQVARRNRLVSPFISVPKGVPPRNRIKEYKFNENDSDADETIDETRRQMKIDKEKNRPTIAECFYDIAGNAEECIKKNTYHLGSLKEEQSKALQNFLEQKSTLFAWEGEMLGRTNLIKYYINTEDQQKAFENLKKRLTLAPILAYPDFSKTFMLFTDVSDIVLGAILFQKDNLERKQVISYASRSLILAEKNYPVTEKECLTIV